MTSECAQQCGETCVATEALAVACFDSTCYPVLTTRGIVTFILLLFMIWALKYLVVYLKLWIAQMRKPATTPDRKEINHNGQ